MLWSSYFVLSYMLLISTLVLGEEDRSDWIDPNDMINFDHSTGKMMNKKPLDIPENLDELKAGELDLDIVPPNSDSEHIPQDGEIPNTKNVPHDSDIKSLDGLGEPVDGHHAKANEACVCDRLVDEACDKASLPLLRQYVTTLARHLQHEGAETDTVKQDYVLHISLSASQISILESFSKTGKQSHVHDVHEILHDMISHITTSGLSDMEKQIQKFEHKIGLTIERLVQFVMLISLASMSLLIEVKLQVHWRRRISQLVIFMFIISFFWTWYELYKQAEIKQQTTVSKEIPSECTAAGAGYWATIKSYVVFQEDKCLEYYDHLLIDPIIKVPPTKAMAVTIVRFFLAPLKDVGTGMSEFLRALLIDLPVTLYPVALVMVCVFVFMFLFMWFGYSIRTFFLSVERSGVAVDNSHVQAAIEQTAQQTLKHLDDLKSSIEDREAELLEKMEHLQRVQQCAIEYNMSNDESMSSATSPTLSRPDLTKPDLSKPDLTKSDRSPSKIPGYTPVNTPAKHTNAPSSPKSTSSKIPQSTPSKTGNISKSSDNNLMTHPSSPVTRAMAAKSCDNIGAEGLEYMTHMHGTGDANGTQN